MAAVEKLVTVLEMTEVGQLRPAEPGPALDVQVVAGPTQRDTARIRRLHDAIATPHHWSSLQRTDQEWEAFLLDPDRRHLIAVAAGEDVGWACLQVEGPATVRIASFGLRPDALGRGYGASFLTEVVREAWRLVDAPRAAAATVGRVWLSTSSWDHPHALANYRSRGFDVTRRQLQHQRVGSSDRHTRTVEQPPALLVRPAVAVDAADVRVLLEELGYPLPVEVVAERLAGLAARADAVVAVAALHGRVVGVVSAHEVPRFAEPEPSSVRITALSVAASSARSGAGAMLLRFVEHAARTAGSAQLEVSSGRRAEREAAHRFYPALGFVDAGATSVRYVKPLTDPRSEADAE